MKKKNDLLKPLWLMLILFLGGILNAQDECTVLMPEIAGSYTGKCKNGLAHGKGLATGMDTYKGRFSKGLPDGSGKYTWADGRIYEGSWSAGMRDGKGTMTYPGEGGDSIVSGIWKENEYLGKELLPPYRVTRVMSVTRSNIKKINDMGSGIRVGVFLAGKFNFEIEDFSMASDSGEQFQSGQYYGIQNAIVPYSVSIKYRTWNQIHTQQHDVIFEFTINEPGTYEVTIHN